VEPHLSLGPIAWLLHRGLYCGTRYLTVAIARNQILPGVYIFQAIQSIVRMVLGYESKDYQCSVPEKNRVVKSRATVSLTAMGKLCTSVVLLRRNSGDEGLVFISNKIIQK
jgi:hypothetical protein